MAKKSIFQGRLVELEALNSNSIGSFLLRQTSQINFSVQEDHELVHVDLLSLFEVHTTTI